MQFIPYKGIVLAGGTGSRLHPVTIAISKQLLPVYDKPMIYYPISTLLLGGIKHILIITTPDDLPRFKRLLGDGSRIGVKFEYAVQPEPRGIAEAFIIGKEFIGNNPVCLILGDNLFYGRMEFLRNALKRVNGATIFAYPVKDPWRYGVVEFDSTGRAISIVEKPEKPRSRYAVPGLYCYDNRVVDIVTELKPSARGELEITDVNQWYLRKGELYVELLGRGIAWLDTGTPESLIDASQFVASIENRQGLKIGCIEEVAYRMGYISIDKLEEIVKDMGNNLYTKYLVNIIEEERKQLVK